MSLAELLNTINAPMATVMVVLLSITGLWFTIKTKAVQFTMVGEMFRLLFKTDQIEAAFNTARETKGQPTAIVMKTVKGKDVSFMENNAGWHGKAPNDAEHEQAMKELKAILAELEGK